MATHVALLRGVNVGGKSLVKMAELQQAAAAAGLQDVQTYIQSGNIIFSSDITDPDKIAAIVKAAIQKSFVLDIGVAVFSKAAWQKIIKSAPRDWGHDETKRHNLLVLIKPYDVNEVMTTIGELKPEVETLTAGNGVIYHSLSIKLHTRTRLTRVVGRPVYKQMTIRNYNTASKLLALM